MMDALAQFHVLRPAWLLLAPAAAALWWWWRRSTDPLRGWREQMDPELLMALATRHERNHPGPDGALLMAWFLAAVAIAGPTWRREPGPLAENAPPLLILLKATGTMERDDLAPSRLERAHLEIADLANARNGEPLGLMAYAGSAHLVLPPTRDTAVIAQMAAEIGPGIMPTPGDRLDLALAEAGTLLAGQETTGSILVVADGVEADVDAIAESHRQAGKPAVQFLAANVPGTSEDDSLRRAARTIGARVVPLSADGTDVEAIVRRAARPPTSRSGDLSEDARWQEGGWYLVPVLALMSALGFRRKRSSPEEVSV